MNAFARFIESGWYGSGWKTFWLLPLSLVFWLLSSCRRIWLKRNSAPVSEVPVIVIGNIAVGGTGKTPLACTLVKELRERGLMPGIISRGYLSNAPEYPYQVKPSDDASVAGDEPLLLSKRTGCPVVIGSDRNEAIRLLTRNNRVDVILSDDGLQNYAMHRDYELIVVDKTRMFGNGWLLPAGPLREGEWRTRTVNQVLVNGDDASMTISPESWVNAATGERRDLHEFSGKAVTAVAGIGNPERFFSTLKTLKVVADNISFPDHHTFTADDIDYPGTVVMTEKDWVKCRAFAGPDCWYLEVGAMLAEDVKRKIIDDVCARAQASVRS